jgi:hypothetical protein
LADPNPSSTGSEGFKRAFLSRHDVKRTRGELRLPAFFRIQKFWICADRNSPVGSPRARRSSTISAIRRRIRNRNSQCERFRDHLPWPAKLQRPFLCCHQPPSLPGLRSERDEMDHEDCARQVVPLVLCSSTSNRIWKAEF